MIMQAKLSPLGEYLRDLTIRAVQENWAAAPSIGYAIKRWNADREIRLAYDPQNPSPISV